MKFNAITIAMRKSWLPPQLLLIMKLTTLLLFILFMQASARGFSQITIHVTNTPLETVFKSIKDQTGYVFFYTGDDLKSAKVSISVDNASIDNALNICLRNLPYNYKIIDNNIVFQKKEELIVGNAKNFTDLSIKITGVVTDEKGMPLPGATIRIKSNISVFTTNNYGRFTIEAPADKKGTILIISYLGFKTQEIRVIASAELIVKMQEDLGHLDQVQIIGYGTASKRNNVGSSFSVSGDELEKVPLPDPILALQGRAPGLEITPTSGLPGSSVNVQIRGVNSLNRNTNNSGIIDPSNSPLYIVDGVPFISTPLNSQGVGSNMGVYNSAANSLTLSSPFKSINAADIESIEVLKDAASTAIYGARGANGVILITTKKGKAGQTKLDIDSYTGIGRVPKFINTLKTPEYLTMRKEAFKNDGGTPTSDPNDFLGYAPDLTVWDPNAYTNWQKRYAGGSAVISNIQATLSGGNEQTRFLFNSGYRNQTTVFPGDYGLKQGSFRLNVDHNSPDKRFNTTISVMYSTDINKLLSTDPYSYFSLPPNMPINNPDGSFNFFQGSNPEASVLSTYQDRTKNLNSNMLLGYQILKGLNLKVSIGYNRIQQDQVKKYPLASFAPGSGAQAERNQSTNLASTYIAEPQLNYTTEIGAGTLQALVGGTYQQTGASTLYVSGVGYTNDDLLDNLSSAPTIIANTFESSYKYLSVFSRINYNWKGKYIVDITGRRDGSSRFGPANRFGTFGAAGAAWIFTEESWMKNISFLSFGKLRGSYGITGNDKIGDYQYYNTYQSNSSAPYQTVGYTPNSLFNANYRWETNKKLEAAIELGFLKDRILLTADYYRNRTGNSLVSYPLPSQTGFSGVTQNLDAKIQNSGFEFSLITTNINAKDFKWTTSLNLSLQRNKLLSFPGLAGSPYNSQYTVGQSISNTHGFLYDGVDPKTGAAKIKDLNGNGILYEYPNGNNTGDQTIIANTLPSFYGGINNSFLVKNWQLDLFFNYRKLDQMPYLANIQPGSTSNIDHTTTGRWQNPGDITNIPRYATQFLNPNTFAINDAYFNYLYLANSNYYLRSGSYIRLSNISLSYTMPKQLAQPIGLQNVRVYISAQNLFTISSFPGPDPDTGLSMPQLRIVTAGTKITL